MATTTKTTATETTTEVTPTTEVNNNGIDTITARVKGITLYDSESGATIWVTLDKSFQGIIKKNDYGIGETDHFYITRGKFTAQCCEANDDIALYRACQTNGFNQQQLALLFIGAKITINRHFHSAGEILEGSDTALEFDCYVTDIIDVQLTDRALRKLDSALTL